MINRRCQVAILLMAVALPMGCASKEGITPVQTAFNRGAYHFSNGDYDAAIHEYRQAVRADPSDHRARFNLGVALETKARRVDGHKRETLRQRAAAVYRALVKHAPDHLRGNVNLAAIEYEQDRQQAARERLQRMLEAYPDHTLPRTALAAHLIERGKLNEARKHLTEAKRIDSASVRVNMLLGRCYARLDKLGKAAAAYQRALQTNPADLASLMALARVQQRRGQTQRAISALRRVLLIDADHWAAHMRLGALRRQRGELAAAAHHLRRAQALDHQRGEGRAQPDYTRRLKTLYTKLADTNTPKSDRASTNEP